MLLPVLALYVESLPDATGLGIGLAVGVYGLTQAVLQIPFGWLSDRYGRKPVIAAGLLLFAIGGVVAAQADSVLGVIVGRGLQGAGAISAAVTALLADLVRDQYRTRAMAFIGAGIGMTFVLSIVLGPLLAESMGIRGLFGLTVLLSLLGLVVLFWWVPSPPAPVVASKGSLPAGALADLLVVFAGIFLLHCVLTGLFVGLPFVLRDQLGMPAGEHWQVYLWAVLLSLTGTIPLVKWSESSGGEAAFKAAVFLILVAQGLILLQPDQRIWIMLGVTVFFAGFNYLEAGLPALVSRLAPTQGRGAALGVYATCQFGGAFAGAALAGLLLDRFDVAAIFTMTMGLAALWITLLVFVRPKPSSG